MPPSRCCCAPCCAPDFRTVPVSRALRLTAGAVAVVLGAVLTPAAAFGAEPTPEPDARYFLSPAPASQDLDSQVDRQQTLLDEQQAQLNAAMIKANAALEAHQLAKRQAGQAARKAVEERARLVAAEAATVKAREQVADYAGSLYRTGSQDRSFALFSAVLDARTPQQMFGGLGLARRVGGNQGNAFVGLAAAEATQEVATTRAATADAAQKVAKQRAEDAKRVADAVVAAQKDQVAERTVALLRTQAAAAAARAEEQERASLLARAELIARARSQAPSAAIDGAFVARPNAACKGLPTEGYPNGRIPEQALCALWGTKDQMLRADAAAAFNDMSRAYAQQFGTPICVGDSYRNYDEQVAVKAAKPGLAAAPGSSNHGWGLATDLCDGIQQFGSPSHRWMQDNSLIYGFFHPSWAQQGGSKPEPWHWEFAG